jgi:hypothetical protein
MTRRFLIRADVEGASGVGDNVTEREVSAPLLGVATVSVEDSRKTRQTADSLPVEKAATIEQAATAAARAMSAASPCAVEEPVQGTIFFALPSMADATKPFPNVTRSGDHSISFEAASYVAAWFRYQTIARAPRIRRVQGELQASAGDRRSEGSGHRADGGDETRPPVGQPTDSGGVVLATAGMRLGRCQETTALSAEELSHGRWGVPASRFRVHCAGRVPRIVRSESTTRQGRSERPCCEVGRSAPSPARRRPPSGPVARSRFGG